VGQEEVLMVEIWEPTRHNDQVSNFVVKEKGGEGSGSSDIKQETSNQV